MSKCSVEKWMHDDITFCIKEECDNKECFRHPVNIKIKEIPHSFAMFEGTDTCPLTNKRK